MISRVLAGMTWARAHVREAQLLEQRSDIALVIVDAETLADDALEVDASPAHDAIDFPVGARLHDGGQLSLLVWATGATSVRSPKCPAGRRGRPC